MAVRTCFQESVWSVGVLALEMACGAATGHGRAHRQAGAAGSRRSRCVTRSEPSPVHCVRVPQMNDNLLESWSDLDELKGAKGLETVYLERNPLQKDPQYRRKVMLALPSVRQIDATFVRF